MGARRLTGATWAALAVLLVSCAAPQTTALPQSSAIEGQQAQARKRITMVLRGEVVVLSETARQGGPGGSTVMEELLNAGLAFIDDEGLLHPQIAEAVPTIDNGLWQVFTDGRMETRWRIRPGVSWHDGAPFTTDDLLFTSMVERDKEVPRASRPVAYESIDGVEAPDDRTVVVRWKRPFIDADRMFTSTFSFSMPMPRHILEKPYYDDKLTVMQHPHWTSELIGTGPYRLREFVRSSHLVLDANGQYVLGRPKIDEIEVKLVQDNNALIANVLSGGVELNLGGNLSIEQGLQVRDQWRDGRVEMGPGGWVVMYGQLLDPNPPIVANLQFRRAMLHAIDRQQMADTLQHGATPVAHSFLGPNQPQYREIEAGLIRYEYDPRKAVQMIEGLGYTRGVDGFFRPDSSGRDAANQKLSVELRTTTLNELQLSSVLAVADYWQRIGITVDQLVIPIQRQNDLEYRATYPAFELLAGTPSDVRGIGQLHSSKARVPQNNFVGSNYARYINPEFDALIDRYFVTIPKQERRQVLGQIIYHISENLNAIGLFYNASPLMIGNRLVGVAATTAPSTSPLWNIHEWDVR